jgi:hypothetical protein
MPSRGNHISDTWDLHTNWQTCRNYYGPDFNFQLFKVDRRIHKVWLPPLSMFTTQVHDYLNNKHNGHFNFFKTQWLISDYLTVGWRYPVQAVWNWRMRWWEIHPGFLRGLIYNFLEVQEWEAWYQPMTDKTVDYIHKFTDPDDLMDTMGFRDCHHVDAELIGYFDKPLIKMCIHIDQIEDAADKFGVVFYNNVNNGLNITGDKDVIDKIKLEISSWPDHQLKDVFVFNESGDLPTLYFDQYDKDTFYKGIYFAGTKLSSFNRYGINYNYKLYLK